MTLDLSLATLCFEIQFRVPAYRQRSIAPLPTTFSERNGARFDDVIREEVNSLQAVRIWAPEIADERSLTTTVSLPASRLGYP
jgi:hypothetical protein